MKQDFPPSKAVVEKWISIEDTLRRLSVVQARAISLLVIAVNVLTVPAVAADDNPIDQVGSAMCDTGIGDLAAIGLAAISMYLIFKAGVRATIAFDKLGDARSETQFEGKKQLAGSGKTLAGAFVPVAFGGILEAAGISTVSCLNFTIGLMITFI